MGQVPIEKMEKCDCFSVIHYVGYDYFKFKKVSMEWYVIYLFTRVGNQLNQLNKKVITWLDELYKRLIMASTTNINETQNDNSCDEINGTKNIESTNIEP